MVTLVANYDIELEAPVLLKMAEDIDALYEVDIDGFQVSLLMKTERCSARKEKGHRNWSVPYNTFIMKVAKEEPEFPPKVIPNEEGTWNYTIQHDYFKDRKTEYGQIAVKVANRAINYLRFRLWQPLLVEIEANNHYIMNPKWTDENGIEVGKSGGYLSGGGVAAWAMEEFGARALEKKHDTSLSRYLKNPTNISLTDEILYDAQSAIYQENYRRAVLEMALSVEISTKQKVFGKESHSGIAFEYLEDKGKVNIRVLELIDGVSLQVFGQSFKKEFPNEYKEIDYLFRCRNKIAHRGEVVFKDDSGVLFSVDVGRLKIWWSAITTLLKWLRSVKNT